MPLLSGDRERAWEQTGPKGPGGQVGTYGVGNARSVDIYISLLSGGWHWGGHTQGPGPLEADTPERPRSSVSSGRDLWCPQGRSSGYLYPASQRRRSAIPPPHPELRRKSRAGGTRGRAKRRKISPDGGGQRTTENSGQRTTEEADGQDGENGEVMLGGLAQRDY